VTAARQSYLIAAVEQDGVWIARATREDTGGRFGIESRGRTEQEATDRLTRWLEWQHEHEAALEALQEAERAYHRAVSGRAFTHPAQDADSVVERHKNLEALEAARLSLDAIRSRRPETQA